jgi:NADH-quinone oxidoreductase subunit L
LVVVAAGVAVSVWRFGPRRDIPVEQPATRSPFTLAGRNDLYGDAFNEAIFMRPGQRMTSGLTRLEDGGIDATVNGTGAVISGFSARLRRVQNGFVRSYALTMMAGAAVVGAVIVLGRLG